MQTPSATASTEPREGSPATTSGGSRAVVLHHVVVRGLADADALARAAGLDVDTVRAELVALARDELVVERTGRLTGYAPTPEGKEVHRQALVADPLRARRRELAEWYERFEEVNAELKALCTAWQIVDGPDGQVPNDHHDPDYDAAVLDRLEAVHGAACALLREVADDRLDRYAGRLEEAMAAVRSGDVRRFTAPRCESYHDVWMELHHDLLASFDRRRGAADA